MSTLNLDNSSLTQVVSVTFADGTTQITAPSTSSIGDNLGDHTATQDLNLDGRHINNASVISAFELHCANTISTQGMILCRGGMQLRGDTDIYNHVALHDSAGITINDGSMNVYNGSINAFGSSTVNTPSVTFADGTVQTTACVPINTPVPIVTSAPDANFDGQNGYLVGTIVVDSVGKEAYICVDNSAGAAIWKQI